MNLKLFFSPVSSDLNLPTSGLVQSVTHLQEEGFDISQMHLALVGLLDSEGTTTGADNIRHKLYGLKKGSPGYRLADLGNLKNGPNSEETEGRIREVCESLMNHGVTPLLIGGAHEYSFPQFQAYESAEKLVSVLNVDAKLDMEEEGEAKHTFLTRLLTHQPNYLFSYNHLAHQSYLVEAGALGAIDKLYFDSLRLGELRENLQETEPLIRLADMMTFDITAIRSADAPGNDDAQPFGLTGEEACQLCWYAGMNDKLNSLGIYGYQPKLDDAHQKTAAVIAIMLWYFIEGFYNRKDNGRFDSDNYHKYLVPIEGLDEPMVFYKSKLTEKWWMLVTYGEKHSEKAYIPCSYADYTAATHSEIPERWITAQGKLV